MIELEKVKLAGQYWYIDLRLNEARKVKNPHESMTINEFNTLLLLEGSL